MIVKNRSTAFIIVVTFLSLVGFLRAETINKEPKIIKTNNGYVFKIGNDNALRIIPKENNEIIFLGKTYLITKKSGTQDEYEVSIVEDDEQSDIINQSQSRQNTLINQPAITSSISTHPNLQQNSNPLTPSVLQTLSHRSNHKETDVIVKTDDNKNLSSSCQTELQDIYTVKLASYIEALVIKERKNSNMTFDQKLSDSKLKEFAVNYEIIKDFLTYAFHLKNNTLDQFKSRFEDEGNETSNSQARAKPTLVQIIKEQGGINITSKELVYNDQGFQTYYPGTILRVVLNHIPGGNLFSTFCELNILTGTGNYTYNLSDKCNNFDISQGGQIRYKIFEGNTVLDNGGVVLN